jgi:lycopene beta-cyclase
MNNSVTPVYDFTFLGMGCGNSLLLLELERKGLLKDKKILVLEPDAKVSNDRTFCFWMKPETLEERGLRDMVRDEWTKVIVANNSPQELKDSKYYHIQGIALYEKTRKLLQKYEVKIIDEAYFGSPSQLDNYLELSLADEKILSHYVFDNRPPTYASPTKSDVQLYQSFYGWVIQTEENTFDVDCFTMMDFKVEQSGATQFMYVLPFDPQRALFEITRFGEKVISKEEAEQTLHSYLKNKGIAFTIEDKEQGIIRMFNCPMTNQSKLSNWIDTGERGACLKPSTGYSFVRSLHHAERIGNYLLDQRKSVQRINGRYAYYDRLLLQILRDHPSKGKEIFTRLFSRNNAETVFNFLDEQSTPKEEFSILNSLPVGLFAGAAIKDFFSRYIKEWRQIPIVLWMTLLAIILYQLNGEMILLSMLGTGMLVVGIPHGALDHLHVLKAPTLKGLIAYIIKYIGLGSMVLALFWLSPAIGLILFLAYSAWHFGEADFSYWGFKNKGATALWGLYFLGALLLSHSKEVIIVICEMNIPLSIDYSFIDLFSMIWMFAGGIGFLFWKRQRVIFYSITALILLQYLPIIAAFAIFFIGQHSVHGWTMLKRVLPDSDFQLWIKALPFTLGAIALLILMIFFTELNWGQCFIFLAALSFPHVLLMYKLDKKLD